MCFYLKLFAATIKVLNGITADSNATIQLRSGNFTSNFTINYKPCSGDPSKIQFRPPVVHLVNLTADIMYCYSMRIVMQHKLLVPVTGHSTQQQIPQLKHPQQQVQICVIL